MNGKELRGTMWKQVKGRRGYLLLGLAITMVPLLLQNIIMGAAHMTLPFFLNNPFGILTNLLTIGLCKIAMEQVAGGEKRIGDMFFFCKGGLLGKALVLSVILWVANTAFTVLPSLLQQYGTDMMAQAATIETLENGVRNLIISDQGVYAQGEIFNGLGMLLNLGCGFIGTVLFFPIQYRFALYPDAPVMDQLAESVSLGWKNFWGVFGYRFTISLPLMIALLAYMGCSIFLPEFALFVIAALIALLCYYLPYLTLAEAGLAKRLFVMEEQGSRR